MIETIFYFAANSSDYHTKWDQREISDRTICFVPGENAIYKGGVKYGGWTTQEFHEHMTEYENYDDSWINDELAGIKGDIADSNTRIQ